MQLTRQITTPVVRRQSGACPTLVRPTVRRATTLVRRAYVPYNDRDAAEQSIDEEAGLTQSQARKEQREFRVTLFRVASGLRHQGGLVGPAPA